MCISTKYVLYCTCTALPRTTHPLVLCSLWTLCSVQAASDGQKKYADVIRRVNTDNYNNNWVWSDPLCYKHGQHKLLLLHSLFPLQCWNNWLLICTVECRVHPSSVWVWLVSGRGQNCTVSRFYIVMGKCFNVKLTYCHHILVWLILQGTKIRRTLLCQQCSIETRTSKEHLYLLFTISLNKGRNASEQWQCTTVTVYKFNV